MPTFEIEQYEIHSQTYRIEAKTEAEAIKQLMDGEAEAVDNGLEYVQVAEGLGLPVENFPDLADELQTLGVSVDEDIIPSIRRIEQID